MPVTVRPAVPGDYDAICDLMQELDAFHIELRPEILQPYTGRARTREHVSRYIGNEQRIMFLAELDGQAAGLAAVETVSMPEHPMFRMPVIAMLMELVALPSHRRNGVGRLLLDSVRAWTVEHGIGCLQVNVQSGNEAALRFYQAMGFGPFLQRLWMFPGQSS